MTPPIGSLNHRDASFDGYRFSADGGANWGSSSVFNGVRITAVPAPSALVAFAGFGLLSTRRRR